jgi:stage V sporulation protein D (sporulation-specific penicillin-binding protein)
MKSYHNVLVQKNRIAICVAVFILIALAIVGRLFYLQAFRHNYFVKAASSQHWIKDTIPAERGKIYADDSLSNTPYVLATNQKLDVLYVNPKEVQDKYRTSAFLALVTGMKQEEVLAKFDETKLYVTIKRKLDKGQSDRIKEAKIKGVGVAPENWRYYPEAGLAGPILGFVNDESVGNYGLEEYFDEILSGTPGILNQEADNAGVKIAFGDNVSKPAVNGDDIYLTIDRYIQGKAEQLLTEAVKKFGAPSGTVIVMNPKTGAILAMANSPSFDPNKYAKMEEKDYASFKNRAVTDVYEPGSIFKVITMACGLDDGKVTPDTKYNDTGSVTLNGHKIMNSTKKSYGEQTMTFVLEQSLNTGSTYVQQKLGKNSFFEYLKKFGFGTLTGIEMPGEGAGRIYEPKEVNDHTYATMSFGQSISVTPIQMATSIAAIANKGKMMKPFIVKKTVDAKNKAKITKPKEIRQVISEKAAADLSKMMVSVVLNGHGKQAGVKGYKVAGKTGTAQIPKKDGVGYEVGKNIGSFVGFAPADDAQFVVLAKIDEPKGVPWAEESAAPLVGSMLDFLLKYYQVPPTESIK